MAAKLRAEETSAIDLTHQARIIELYKSDTLFHTIKHTNHTNITAIPATMNWNTNFIAFRSTGTAKHRNDAHRKLLLKTQVSEKFLHSEVNLIKQYRETVFH